MSEQATVSADTRAMSEELAFERYMSVLQVAYEREGFLGAIQVSAAIATEYDKLAVAAEAQGSRDLVRSIVAGMLAQETLPELKRELSKV